MSGIGVLKTANGNMYEGSFSADAMHGIGKYSFSTGEVYDGDYDSNKRSGRGKFTFVNGDVFTGSFIDDKFTTGTMFLTSENAQYAASFTGGDEISNGARVYDVVLRTPGSGEIFKSGKFTKGAFI
jgi:hypothetical protein